MAFAEEFWEEFVQEDVFPRCKDDMLPRNIRFWFRVGEHIGTMISMEKLGRGLIAHFAELDQEIH